MGVVLKILTVLIPTIAIVIGVFISPIPRSLGLYRWVAQNVYFPRFVGCLPAMADDQEQWGFTFEQLYAYNLTGQTALVTGANSGTGYECALALARLGASVTLACRNEQKCRQAVEKIQQDEHYLSRERHTRGDVSPMILDTSSLNSVQSFAQTYRTQHNNNSLDMLFLNAGMAPPEATSNNDLPLSQDGIELVFATNHVGHHLLYQLLEPLLLKSDLARVVLTSSAGSFQSYSYKVATDLQTLNGVNATTVNDRRLIYGQSKLAQVLFAQEVTRRHINHNNNIYVNAAHPGVVNTAIFDQIMPSIPTILHGVFAYLRENGMWTAAEGALTLLYLGVATDHLVAKKIQGKYFHPQSVQVNHPLTQREEELQQKLWQFCDELVSDYAYLEKEEAGKEPVEAEVDQG